MIIRALRLRHGRLALPRNVSPCSPQLQQHQRRHQTTTTEESVSEQQQAPAFIESPAQAQLNVIPNLRTVTLNDPNHPVAQKYAFHMHEKARTQHLGAGITPHYKPHELVNHPPSPKDITLELLLASQAHIGHATSLWHPANARYIFGIRGSKDHGETPIHIISLDQTAAHLRRACKIVSGVTERGGLVLFVGTREGQARAVVKAASMAKGCHLFTKWIPGSITNGQQILGRCAKKVVDENDKEVAGFEDQLGTKAAVKPDLVVCLNPLENYVLLHECGLNNIPTIGIIDTDANPTWVTYPIPANDDSLRCVQVIAGVLGRAGQEGQEKRLSLAKQNVITYAFSHGLSPPKRNQATKQQTEQRQRPVQFHSRDLNIPADLAGVEVKQYQEDRRLLDAAESTVFSEPSTGLPDDASTSTARLDIREAAADPAKNDEAASFEEEEEEDDELDLNSSDDEAALDAAQDSSSQAWIDQSLTSDEEASPADDYLREDYEQFGGVDQLQRTPSSGQDLEAESPLSPLEAMEEDPMCQVEEVAKELGEEPIATENVSVEPAVAAKAEEPVAAEAVPVVEATSEGTEKEEKDGKNIGKPRGR